MRFTCCPEAGSCTHARRRRFGRTRRSKANISACDVFKNSLSWNLLSQSAGAALIASSPSFWRERIEVRVVPEEIALTIASHTTGEGNCGSKLSLRLKFHETHRHHRSRPSRQRSCHASSQSEVRSERLRYAPRAN